MTLDAITQACEVLTAQGTTPSANKLVDYAHAQGWGLTKRTALKFLRANPPVPPAPQVVEPVVIPVPLVADGLEPVPRGSAGRGRREGQPRDPESRQLAGGTMDEATVFTAIE